MDKPDKATRRAEEKLRREAAYWFARLRRPDAEKHQRAFEVWCSEDSKRRAAYERLLARWDGAAVLAAAQAQRFEGSRARAVRRVGRPGPWHMVGLAAGAALVAFVVSPLRPTWLDAWPIPSLGSQRVATGIGEIRTVRLSDGSSVTLDTDTLVATHFSSGVRRLNLVRGRARFDVMHDAVRPFIVAAGGGTVAARGTAFDVSVAADQKVAVTLIRGVIDVDSGSDVSVKGGVRRVTARLSPGQQIAFGGSLRAPRIQPAAPAAALWPSGLLAFEATPLSQAVAQANRYSRNRIVLVSPALGSLKISGVFKVTAPREFAESLAVIFRLHLEDGAAGDLILRPSPTSAASAPGAGT